MITWCMDPEIWWTMDGQMDGHMDGHMDGKSNIEVGAPPKSNSSIH